MYIKWNPKQLVFLKIRYYFSTRANRRRRRNKVKEITSLSVRSLARYVFVCKSRVSLSIW